MRLYFSFESDPGTLVTAGSVIRWHKDEGERVEYGDDLLDFQVEEIAVSHQWLTLKPQINLPPRELALKAARQLAENDHRIDDPIDGDEPLRRFVMMYTVRVTASDSGYLTSRVAEPGEPCRRGDVLAHLSGTRNGASANGVPAADAGREFRVVVDRFYPAAAEISDVPASSEAPDGRVADGDEVAGRRAVVVTGRAEGRGGEVGLYSRGQRYMTSLFALQPLLETRTGATTCIFRDGVVNHRSDAALQTLEQWPPSWIADSLEWGGVKRDFFAPVLFDKTIRASMPEGLREFPKRAVFLSIVPDVVDIAYRHKEHGFLVCPLPLWRSMRLEDVAADNPPWKLFWLRNHFEPIGKLTVEEFHESFGRLVREVRERTGAAVIAFNAPTVGERAAHDLQFFVEEPTFVRRQAFNVALCELSRELDFPIVDVDRLVKRCGTTRQAYWDLLHPDLYPRVAEIAFGVLRDLSIV